MIWPSRRNPGGLAVGLFQDRCEELIVRRPIASIAIDGSSGLNWLNRRLAALHTYVCPPDGLPDDEFAARAAASAIGADR